jgi:diaminopimelate decarboxylase
MTLETFGDIGALAERHGTPLVVYSEAVIRQSVARLKAALPTSSSLAYSIKANPNPSLLHLLVQLGLMTEAASAGELVLALNSGVPPERIFLGGPTKGRVAVETAARAGIAGVLVESTTDLDRVRAVASDVGATLDVLLRVNPGRLSSTSVLRMGGIASPFGIDEELLPRVVRECSGDGVRYAGVFLYAGSQHFSATDIVENTRYLCQLSLQLSAEGCPPARIIDFGGGFGIPEDDSQSDLDLRQLKEGLDQVFCEEVPELARLGLEQTAFESGRYVVSRAGVYVARVMDVKRSHGKRFAVLDGGINNLGIRQLLYRTFEPRIKVWGQEGCETDELITLVGPTCTPIDVVHKGCPLPGLREGDLIVVRDFGAYTSSYSPIHFCGHPWPAEVLVPVSGQERVTRRRARLDEACGMGYIRPNE